MQRRIFISVLLVLATTTTAFAQRQRYFDINATTCRPTTQTDPSLFESIAGRVRFKESRTGRITLLCPIPVEDDRRIRQVVVFYRTSIPGHRIELKIKALGHLGRNTTNPNLRFQQTSDNRNGFSSRDPLNPDLLDALGLILPENAPRLAFPYAEIVLEREFVPSGGPSVGIGSPRDLGLAVVGIRVFHTRR